MKVNVVLWQDNHIIPRMTQWLADDLGWTVSGFADLKADVNYFMPYLQFGRAPRPDTKTAAWFTHFELGTTWKERAWKDAAKHIDLPLITSPVYDFLERSKRIIPGVETDIYTPNKVKTSERCVVGIVGVGQPRKGPELIVSLFYSGFDIEIRIVGPNWPFPSISVPPGNMPEFYNSIDVLVCTSTIEGIPMPVLEAMSCGISVVVPEQVGICSELPEAPGVYHYTAGDSLTLLEAVKRAQIAYNKPNDCRDIVLANYTKEHWVESNQKALEDFYADIPI